MNPTSRHYYNNTLSPQRIDKFLCETLNISRKEALKLLEQDVVKQEEKTLSEKDKGKWLEPGDFLEIQSLQPLLGKIRSEPQNTLGTLYKDNNFLMIDKPAGMPVMPLQPDELGTVLNHIVASHPQIQGVGEKGLKSGVVHRLDNDTSGCLMLALNQAAWQEARTAFKLHKSQKIYRSLVAGQVKKEGHFEAHLEITQHKPAKVKVVTEPSKQSRLCTLSWKVIENFATASLLEIKLETGFLHQIRVIFAHLGHPVLGDALYGEASSSLLAPRQMLHAYSLNVLGIHGKSPEPKDFQNVLASLRQTQKTPTS